jgi:predicted DNA binding CopG/RHH family protein
MSKTLKPYPDFHGDDEAEQKFMDTHDLSKYDFAPHALPAKEWFSRYEHYKKDASVHLRLPGGLIEAVRQVAAKQNVPMQRLIRYYIERGIKEDA